MNVLLRVAALLLWLAWSQILGVLAGVTRLDLLLAVPAVVLVVACLVPLAVDGARAYAVAPTLTAAWLFGVATWGPASSTFLLVTACVLLAVVTDSAD